MQFNLKQSKLFFIILTLSTRLIFAGEINKIGGMEGGGGNSVVCRNPSGSLASAEVYDLFEGRALYDYQTKEVILDYASQARAIAKMMTDTTQDAFFETETERILKEVKFLPSDATLIPIDDSGSIIKPTNCEIYQTAIYLSNNRVYFDSNIWMLLTETNRAALILHEVIYAYLRIYDGTKTSSRARQYVAYLFSGKKLKKNWLPSSDEKYEICRTDYSDLNNDNKTPFMLFYSKLTEDGHWKISFHQFNGLIVLGQTEISSPPPGYGYEWPIASHDIASGIPGGIGVGLSENLLFEVDEGWAVSNWYLDQDSKSNYVTLTSNGKTNKIYFSCQRINF